MHNMYVEHILHETQNSVTILNDYLLLYATMQGRIATNH